MRVVDSNGRIKLSTFSKVDYMLKNPSGSNMRVKGGNWQLYNIDDNVWHTVFAVGPANQEQPAFGGPDSSGPDVF